MSSAVTRLRASSSNLLIVLTAFGRPVLPASNACTCLMSVSFAKMAVVPSVMPASCRPLAEQRHQEQGHDAVEGVHLQLLVGPAEVRAKRQEVDVPLRRLDGRLVAVLFASVSAQQGFLQLSESLKAHVDLALERAEGLRADGASR